MFSTVTAVLTERWLEGSCPSSTRNNNLNPNRNANLSIQYAFAISKLSERRRAANATQTSLYVCAGGAGRSYIGIRG